MKSSNRNTAPFITPKSLRYTALLSVAALGVFSGAQALAAEATTTSTAEVIVPIAITKSADLAFGKFAPGAGGTVTVSTSGDRTAAGPILSTIGSTPTAARFDVTGDGDATYSITWSGVTVLSNTDATPATMALARISDLTGANGISGEVTAGTLVTGAQSIFLGGVLTVGGTQPTGIYSGNVTVAVEYN